MNRPEPTQQEVDEEVMRLVQELTVTPYRAYLYEASRVRERAVNKLWSKGYITDPDAQRVTYDAFTGQPRDDPYRPFYLTPAGWEYWEQLRLGSVLYWGKLNWFPAFVAFATMMVGVATILAQVLG